MGVVQMSNPNEPIFPHHSNLGLIAPGLSKRELFAAMAMQGILANPSTFPKQGYAFAGEVCDHAVLFADYLLAELDGSRATK